MAKILVVEDDTFLCSLLAQNLKVAGFDVATASDGNKAIEVVHSFHPDVILLDLIMPIKDGYGVLEDIHAEGGAVSKIPIIVLSNLSNDKDVARARKYHITDFLVKANTTPQEITHRMKTLLNSPS